MKFGICYSAKRILSGLPQKADYVEITASDFLKAETEIQEAVKHAVAQGKVKIDCACGLIHSQLRLTGETVDLQAIRAYCERICALLAEINVRLVVFGSGAARRVPDGFPEERAWEQLCEVGRILADVAASYGQTVAVEPLSFHETNVIHTVGEAADYAKKVNRDNFKAMVDFYHFDNNGETFASLEQYRAYVAHAHYATAKTRTVPRSEEEWRAFEGFIKHLKEIGYDGCVSFEGGSYEADELDPMLEKMKEIDQAVG